MVPGLRLHASTQMAVCNRQGAEYLKKRGFERAVLAREMSLEEIRSFIAPVKKCGADNLHMFELPGHDRWVKPHPSYYICDEEQAVEEINQYLLPYSDKLTVEDLDFPDLGY